LSRGIQYRVYVTPRTGTTTFGTEVEVTDRVEVNGLREIVRSIDASDYDVGVYVFNDVDLDCDNSDGYFSDETDSRSLFQFSRDLAKVRVVYYDQGVASATFRGLINDEGTRNDLRNDRITFRVLGRDSAIRKTKVIPGAVTSGTAIRNAIFGILNRDEITSILDVQLANINPDQNGTVDDGTKLDNKSTRTVLNELLLASNSVMIITEDDEVIVKSRVHDSVKAPLELFGKGDLQGRENIISISEYNTGLHRLFNAVKLNTVEVSDNDSLVAYGARKKEVSFEWMTDTTNTTTLANRILREWKTKKIEFTVQVKTSIAKGYDLLDRVSVDYPLVRYPTGARLPICGVAVCGNADTPLPKIRGSIVIDPSVGFKIIEIRENPRDFITTLKLRQVGVSETDGFL
jgi:hypothetical protein